ncbi:hypothetical protein [Tortoise microvirus 83]|nr:hypothetical protein [Tortoise microvirus 83]
MIMRPIEFITIFSTCKIFKSGQAFSATNSFEQILERTFVKRAIKRQAVIVVSKGQKGSTETTLIAIEQFALTAK